MTRGISISVAIVAGIAAVYLLPAVWLGPLAAAAAVCAAILGIIVRLATHTESHANPLVGIMSSVFSIPERPLAKVKEGWALTSFLVVSAFLVSLGLSVIVRAGA